MAGALEGKVAIVTGGAQGIGEGIVRAFHAENATVVIADISDGGAKLAADLGGRATAIRADVSVEADVRALIDETVQLHGRLDILCNNAGIDGDVGPTADCTIDNFDRVIAVNLRGVFLGTRFAIPAMLAGGGGSIVNIASIAGLIGAPGLPSYCASKAGVIGLTRAAAVEYAAAGVRVNAVCPGVIHTPMLASLKQAAPDVYGQIIGNAEAMTAMKRVGEPAEIAAATVFLASDASSFMTGTAVPVDGGYTAA